MTSDDPDLPPTLPLAEAPVVLEAGQSFSGVLAIRGPARIEGELHGRIVGPGPLWIAPGGSVEADLELETVVVGGSVRGDIRASARIELLASASVEGDLSAPTLLVADGCHWNGRSRTGTATCGGQKTPGFAR
jgi:cytoskeletal protein CcmA (bactofilin family)